MPLCPVRLPTRHHLLKSQRDADLLVGRCCPAQEATRHRPAQGPTLCKSAHCQTALSHLAEPEKFPPMKTPMTETNRPPVRVACFFERPYAQFPVFSCPPLLFPITNTVVPLPHLHITRSSRSAHDKTARRLAPQAVVLSRLRFFRCSAPDCPVRVSA